MDPLRLIRNPFSLALVDASGTPLSRGRIGSAAANDTGGQLEIPQMWNLDPTKVLTRRELALVLAVASAGVVGIHDLIHGETVRAHVVFRPGIKRPTGAELMQFGRARVGY